MIKLVYADNKWCLLVNGKQVPNSKIVYDSLKMRNDELPSVQIMLDEIDIDNIMVFDKTELKQSLPTK